MMLSTDLSQRLRLYQATAIFSVLFALAGFSYNVWRMENTEQNSNIRMACFEMLTELAALEQLIYTAVYDNDLKEGSPRKGWVKVGLIRDLSVLVSTEVSDSADSLHQVWSQDWAQMTQDRAATDRIVAAIDAVRVQIKHTLSTLE